MIAGRDDDFQPVFIASPKDTIANDSSTENYSTATGLGQFLIHAILLSADVAV